MKRTKRILSLLIAIVLFITINSFSMLAYAQGTGSEDNPYLITTAQQLQDVNNDVTASYKLMANIDLDNMDFTPIGNADVGAFSGNFDGNGYTISNLNVFAGKYAGLFGCNEGTIKDVKLSNVEIYGTRYVGGIVGENAETGVISDCSILSGNIEASGDCFQIYIGGAVGYNHGIINGSFYNSADIFAENISSGMYASGIIGYSKKAINFETAINYGSAEIKMYYSNDCYSYIGGIIGKIDASVNLHNLYNYGNISQNYYKYAYIGGIIGKIDASDNNLYITKSHNSGNIFSISKNNYAGGIVGYSNYVNAVDCYNSGSIQLTSRDNYGSNWSGGIIGYCNSGLLEKNFNNGMIYSKSYSGYYPDATLGGLIGYAGSSVQEIVIIDSYNTGNILVEGEQYQEYTVLGGLIGKCSNRCLVESCYNTGNCYINYKGCGGTIETGGLVGYCNLYVGDNSYSLKSSPLMGHDEYTVNGILISDNELKLGLTLTNWNFESVWDNGNDQNGNYPLLKSNQQELSLNVVNKSLAIGTTLQLKAYKNGATVNDVKYSSITGNANVKESGVVTALSVGVDTIVATDSYGNKSTCNIFIYDNNSFVYLEDFSVNKSPESNIKKSVLIGNDSDYLVNVTSSDDSIVKIKNWRYREIYYNPVDNGVATIFIETAQGLKCSCTVTVTNYATKINLYSATINRGEYKQLVLITTPSPISNKVSYESSDESIATVDENGVVRGIDIGKAIITARTDNGLESTCTVTVNAPAESISVVNKQITLGIGETEYIDYVVVPLDTTDTVSFSTSSSSIASVNSTTGLITAKSTGTATITAKTSSGKTSTCYVTVVRKVTDISLDSEICSLNIGDTKTLTTTISPSNATDQSVLWQSANPLIAQVNSRGVITAVSPGKTFVTATTSSGKVAYCEVTVNGVSDGNIAKIYVPDIDETGKEYIDVPVIIENNPGINFASISVNYDGNNLEPISVSNGTVFSSVTGNFDKDNGKVNLYFTSEDNVAENGNLAIIRYKVLNEVTETTLISLCYLPGAITNADDESVAFNLRDGSVEIELCLHENTEIRNAKASTCTEQGYTGDTYCLDCGRLLETGKLTEIAEHNYQADIVEATENKQGYTKYTCSDCGYSYIGDITGYDSDNSVLLAVLEQIESYSENDYSAESFANLMSVYETYSDMKNESSPQIEIDNAVFDMLTAISELEPYLDLFVRAQNGSFTVSYNDDTYTSTTHSLLFGTSITLNATSEEGYQFVGWYDTINNLYLCRSQEYTFKLTGNTNLKAVFIKESSATLTFTTYSNWVQSSVTKTINEWNELESIDELVPVVPYRYGYSNGRWVYDNADVLARLQTGENVSLIPEYDEDDTSLPNPPSPKGDTPVLDLYYKLDADADVGSFVMAAGIPDDCNLESVGIAFYYKKANEFDPTNFVLNINNKMLVGRFNTDEIEDIYIINMNKMSDTYNWAARGYVTYYNENGNLKTVYSNQINIINREQV